MAYNGYTNYETWVVALWMDNDAGTYDYWQSIADDLSSPDSSEYIADEDEQRRSLADRMKEEYEELLPELQGFAQDLLTAAFSEVDWDDIADNQLKTAAENRAA